MDLLERMLKVNAFMQFRAYGKGNAGIDSRSFSFQGIYIRIRSFGQENRRGT